MWPPAVAAARVLRRGKSNDGAVAKSIDMAACGSVDKSKNERPTKDHSGHGSDTARAVEIRPQTTRPGSESRRPGSE